ncbi:MAG: hypothetical protein ACOC0X_07065, partial [Halobacteriota archaeon]
LTLRALRWRHRRHVVSASAPLEPTDAVWVGDPRSVVHLAARLRRPALVDDRGTLVLDDGSTTYAARLDPAP